MRLSVAFLLLALSATRAGDSVSLGEKVTAYCKDHLNKTVGSGECAALAFQALKAAGARTRGGPTTRQRETTFGAGRFT